MTNQISQASARAFQSKIRVLCGDLYICAKFSAVNYIYLTMDSKRTIKTDDTSKKIVCMINLIFLLF